MPRSSRTRVRPHVRATRRAGFRAGAPGGPSVAGVKILHTSDWHVGRTFHGRDLLREQESVLGGLADTVADERVDVVVVAGDLFDRAVPNAEAVATCSRVLKRILRAGAKVVITPGNHDSAARLDFVGAFSEAGGLH